MKSNQDQFTSTKFQKSILLTCPVIKAIITKQLVLPRGQWVETWGGLSCQYYDSSKRGVIVEKKLGKHLSDFATIPAPETLSLPLLTLASGVALLLLTFIY
jgi:hypothetical protein